MDDKVLQKRNEKRLVVWLGNHGKQETPNVRKHSSHSGRDAFKMENVNILGSKGGFGREA